MHLSVNLASTPNLYEITGNSSIFEFQEIIHPIMVFIKDRFKADLAPINLKLKEENKLVYPYRPA